VAGDWLKMRIDLQSHPKVVRILSATDSDKFRVIGGLHAVWSVFDAHSENGQLLGYTPKTMDHIIGWDGFSQAMIDVGWLFYDGGQVLEMPDFLEHNGKSGKRRAEDQKRKRNVRKKSTSSPENSPQESGQIADKKRTREEKRREDNKTPYIPLSGGQKKFIPPTVEEVKGYCQERGNDVDPEQWVNFYQAKGWYVGKNKMIDWKAAVRTWEKNSKQQTFDDGLAGAI